MSPLPIPSQLEFLTLPSFFLDLFDRFFFLVIIMDVGVDVDVGVARETGETGRPTEPEHVFGGEAERGEECEYVFMRC